MVADLEDRHTRADPRVRTEARTQMLALRAVLADSGPEMVNARLRRAHEAGCFAEGGGTALRLEDGEARVLLSLRTDGLLSPAVPPVQEGSQVWDVSMVFQQEAYVTQETGQGTTFAQFLAA